MTEVELFVREIRPGVYLMDEGHQATGYLVVGEEKACVIDTMNGLSDLGAAVRKITDKPVIVVNTHGHPDHIFGNMYFSEAYLHPADRELARSFVEHPEFLKILEDRKAVFPPFRDILPGDISVKARELHFRLYPLFRDLFIETNPVPVKAALAYMGKIDEAYRLPLCELEAKNAEALTATMRALGLI